MIKIIYKKILKFTKDNQAVSAVASVIFFLSAVTIAGTGSDVLYYNQIRAALQSIADQAVLSGATVARNAVPSPVDVCNQVFQEGLDNAEIKPAIIKILSRTPCVQNNDSISLTTTATVKLYFGTIVGLNNMDVVVTAKASRLDDETEIVYAFSTQGTMCAKKEARVSNNNTYLQFTDDPTCEKFNLVKNGIANSMNILESRFADKTKLKFGLVPYNYKVKLPNTNLIPPSFTALENEPDFFTDLANEEPLPPVVSLLNASNLANIQTRVSSMKLSPSASAWGRSDLGIHTAALMLDPASKQFFNNHVVSDWNVGKKYVVLLADGINSGCCYTNHPTGKYSNQYVYNYRVYNEHMRDVCQYLKNQGVTIFTVLLGVDITDPDADTMNNVMARCASGTYTDPAIAADPTKLLECSKKSYCYNISNQAQLDNAFDAISTLVAKPKLIQ